METLSVYGDVRKHVQRHMWRHVWRHVWGHVCRHMSGDTCVGGVCGDMRVETCVWTCLYSHGQASGQRLFGREARPAVSGCLARKRWFCISQTHISCVQGMSDGPPDRGQLPTVAETCPKRTRSADGIDDSGLSCVPPKTPGGGWWAQGRYDRHMDPRPYLGFA